MKSHIFISVGLVLLAIFTAQAIDTAKSPGRHLSDIYVLGGFIFGGLLIRQGLKDRKTD
jgi:hypothetical protein